MAVFPAKRFKSSELGRWPTIGVDWRQNHELAARKLDKNPFAHYSLLADRNILKAIQLAKQHPRFRYTLEQVVFVQHFWDSHPEAHDDLRALVRNHQLTFAWGGITQPDTSLVAPSIQLHNLLLGRD